MTENNLWMLGKEDERQMNRVRASFDFARRTRSSLSSVAGIRGAICWNRYGRSRSIRLPSQPTKICDEMLNVSVEQIVINELIIDLFFINSWTERKTQLLKGIERNNFWNIWFMILFLIEWMNERRSRYLITLTFDHAKVPENGHCFRKLGMHRGEQDWTFSKLRRFVYRHLSLSTRRLCLKVDTWNNENVKLTFVRI